MLKVGDKVTCLDPADDLRRNYKYEIVAVVAGRVRVISHSYNVSQLLTHHMDRFVLPLQFNVTFTKLPAQSVELLLTFDRNEKSVVLKGSGFKDVFNLYHGGKYLGLVVGTKMEYIIEQVEKKIYQ